MKKLTNTDLLKINGGANKQTSVEMLHEIYRILKIRWLMKKIFVD